MKIKLRTELTAAFLAVTIILFVVISLFANLLLEKQFSEYVVNKQEAKNQSIATLISSRYSDWGNDWNTDGLENIGINALGEGLILRVIDNNDKVIWDARVHNNGMCTMIIEQMSTNMMNHNRNFDGGYVEKSYSLEDNGVKFGEVYVGYYGPYFYNDSDLLFLRTLNNLLLLAAVISAGACIVLGIWMADKLSRPISRVIKAAGNIAAGDFDDRISDKSSTTELVELSDSINSLAESLSKQERIKKQLTSDVAHELRTPIATLQSHLEAMIDGVWAADKERLQNCHEETVRLGRLVGDLENLTQIEDGNMKLVFSEVDLKVLLKRIIMNFESEFRNKGIKLQLQGESAIIRIDEDKISQVIVNLLSNSLKFTPSGGSIIVEILNGIDFVKVVVKDTGIGISKVDAEHIFDRFYRTDKSRNRATGGSGIGLTIAKAIVDAHNGSIMVDSELGNGSSFTVTLPKT